MINRLLSYVSGMKKWMVVASVLMILAKAVEVIVPAWLGRLVQVILGEQVAVDPMGTVIWGIVVIVGLVIGGYLLESVNILILNMIGQKGIFRLRTQLFAHLQRLHIAFFDGQRVGQLISRTINDIERIQAGISEGFVAILANSLLLIGIVIGMFVVDWHMAVVVVCGMPFLYVLATLFRRLQARAFMAVRVCLGQMNVFAQEHLMGARVLRAFAREEDERQAFDRLNVDYREKTVTTVRNVAWLNASIDWIHSTMLVAIFVGLVEYGVSGEQFRAGVFFTFSLYLLAFFRPVIDLTERYNVLQEAMAAASRVFELLDEKPKIRAMGHLVPAGIETIEFEDVWFAYEEENWILRGVSFSLSRGETIALVGETGAGKTTILSLLLRFYDPQRGQIRVNGVDIKQYALHALRGQFSTVLQDPVIFTGTVAENVSLFKAIPVVEPLQYVGAWSLVESWPKGVDTALRERGKSLSSGEKQLISLARAVAHDRSLLLLDEATSNIDPLSEQTIQKALSKIFSERTALVIAHRLSTIERATSIVVLHEGRVIEQGSHTELLAAKGYYEKLYRLQF